MIENCHFHLLFAYSNKFLEPEMECCYLRFYTAERRLEGEHLLKISGIFHASRSMKLGKNARKLMVWYFF